MEKAYQADFAQCRILPGAQDLLTNLSTTRPQMIMALASSAERELFQLKTTNNPELRTFVPEELQIFGDDPDMQGREKKPAPDIFTLTLLRINDLCRKSGLLPVEPRECLVFEDAIAGVEAARRSGMRVIWSPHRGLARVCRGIEQDVLAGRTEENGLQPNLVKLEEESGEGQAVAEVTGVVSEDGMAEMITSLKNFDLDRYSIKVDDDL